MAASGEDDNNSTPTVQPFSTKLHRHLLTVLHTPESKSCNKKREMISLANAGDRRTTFGQSSFSSDENPNSPAETRPTRKRKRESTETVSNMIASLRVDIDVAISGSRRGAPRAQRPQQDLPFLTYESNPNERELYRQYPWMLSPSPRSPRSPRSPVVDKSAEESTKGGEYQKTEEGVPKTRGRQGSLLEWRNKERFEEPLRL